MWILKLRGKPAGIRFVEKKDILEFIEGQSEAIRPHLTYEEKRGIEPKKPTHPG